MGKGRMCSSPLLREIEERERERENRNEKKKALFIFPPAPTRERRFFRFFYTLRLGRICWSAITRKRIGALGKLFPFPCLFQPPGGGARAREHPTKEKKRKNPNETVPFPPQIRPKTKPHLLQVVADFNADPKVHGILVQLPLPKHIDETAILDAIDLEKDVDGFSPASIGSIAMRGRKPQYVSCTPKGCIALLDRSGVEIAGKRAVVVGRSNIVGLPAALLLVSRDATVTVVHSRTPDPESIVREADIVIAAIGRPHFLGAAHIREGAVVIDVGINRIADLAQPGKGKLVGDVAFAEAVTQAAAITPVPGGVGPMTIACLLKNTLQGALTRG